MKNKMTFIALSIILLGIGFSLVYWSGASSKETSSVEDIETSPSTLSKIVQTLTNTNSEDSNKDSDPPPRRKQIQYFIAKEALKVGRITKDPEVEQRRIEKFAKSLSKIGYDELTNISLNIKNEADARFFSVYTLSWTIKKEALPFLIKIAQSKIQINHDIKADPHHGGRKYEEEIALRMQALEGVARMKPKEIAIKNLKEFISSQDNLALIRRAKTLLLKLDN